MSTQFPFPGATTLGIRGKDSVVLASEKRLSYGYFVVSKNVRKVFKITPTIGAACAGLVSDMQNLLKEITAAVNLYQIENQRTASVNSVAKILSNYLFGSRYFPYITETIVGGFDSTGAHVFVLDPLGSLIEDDFAVVGSGAEIAVGVLESSYRPDLSGPEIYDLAVRSMKAAIARDAGSGNGIDILLIGPKGVVKDDSITIS
ncbi:MAG: archaeal proteasome endopeptidase complex subunit beta [Nitrososphaerota archaeon]